MKSGKKNIVVLTGAGISSESGLKTFREAGGLWEGHSVYDVASPEGFERDPRKVYAFYNQRRRQLKEVEPNRAHFALKGLETDGHEVVVVTQNVDDLHERAGSSRVLHLHGELFKARSLEDPSTIYPWEDDLDEGSRGPLGERLRPHVVWFGEDVPMLPRAAELCSNADILIIIGTSLNVYPAAGLWRFVPEGASKYLVDPYPGAEAHNIPHLRIISRTAVAGVPVLVEELLSNGS